MLRNTILAYLACSISVASALRIPSHKRADAQQTTITYFQDFTHDLEACGIKAVSTDSIAPEKCYQLNTASLSISPLHGQDCEYTLYKGSSSCEAHGSSLTTTKIPAGGRSVCLATGVLDGGALTLASGVLHCGASGSKRSTHAEERQRL